MEVLCIQAVVRLFLPATKSSLDTKPAGLGESRQVWDMERLVSLQKNWTCGLLHVAASGKPSETPSRYHGIVVSCRAGRRSVLLKFLVTFKHHNGLLEGYDGLTLVKSSL